MISAVKNNSSVIISVSSSTSQLSLASSLLSLSMSLSSSSSSSSSSSTTVASRIGSEEERVPSYTALWRHWLRSCYVCKLWENSPLSNVYDNLPRPEDSGWISEGDGRYQIDWEAPEVAAKIKSNIDFLLKGCNCKKGCTSKKCGCRKKSNYCGPGCECQGCSNLPVQIQQEEDKYSDDDDDDEEEEEDSDIESDSSDDASDSCDELLETEIITDELFFTADII